MLLFLVDYFLELLFEPVRFAEDVPDVDFFTLLFFAEVLFDVDFFALLFLPVVFFDDAFLELPFVAEAFLEGTFSPRSLASDKPIAIACFREVTFFPLPLFNVPCFLSCIAVSTFLDAAFEYLAINNSFKKNFI